jgi:hypothetical protein
MRTLPLAALLLSGCFVSPGEINEKLGIDTDTDTDADGDADTDADADTDVGDITVVSVDPPQGVLTGGETVVVTAQGLTSGDFAVQFGSKKATIVSVDGDEITVQTPSSRDEGWVDVVVTQGDRLGFLPDGWYYWADGDGLTGAVGELTWYAYQGNYWASSDDPLFDGWLAFVHPTDVRVATLYGTADDTCVRDYNGFDFDFYDTGATSAVLSGDNGDIELAFDSPFFAGNTLPGSGADDYSALQVPLTLELDASDPWPDLEIASFTAPLKQVKITSPNVDGDFVSAFVSESFALNWTTGSTGDFAFAQLVRIDGYTQTVEDRVTCRMRDDGRFQVPSNVWSDWFVGDIIQIGVGRAAVGKTELPNNHGDAQVATIWLTFGAAIAQ